MKSKLGMQVVSTLDIPTYQTEHLTRILESRSVETGISWLLRSFVT